MRLQKLQSFLKEKGWKYEYSEENNCASIDFEHPITKEHMHFECDLPEYFSNFLETLEEK